MTIDGFIERINMRISGLCTLQYEQEWKKIFGREAHILRLYKVNFPEDVRVLLKEFISTEWPILEADVIEYLFDILISGKYKE